ncbi:MAG TPA: glycosyltransferase family 39 protein [Flavobacteriales bacterium]|jgi:4-amino-4-deoxy-L-arabinose transferase-like glycosyltransferase|nr:glycosyltransferase family 39 protein [Flavobacteriales bacterium]MBK6551319.1 glycosyltransferase family 39 protein [Flavobacteriales bacterium]MBK7114048.1 glycosyltransferase family 39 protein [Flavobacteriales bacterium]MBK7619963.1 glycosyltransferase family 39 protein [Flavobacteriales bacterium]MBK9629038.1 glycosyltransferase family 39 protein [Flavobacteriales bacterium]
MLRKALLGVFMLVKILASYLLLDPSFDRHRDEFLHLDQGHHLAWGYASVPPFTSWVSWLIHALGSDPFWVQFFPALFGALTIAVVWWLVRSVGGGLFAQALSATALICSGLLRLDILFQPNSMDVLAWTTVLTLLVQWVRTERPHWLFYAAVVFAVGLLNKYNIAFLGMGALAGLMLTPQRKLLLGRNTLWAAALALVLVSPNLFWQWRNDWPVVAHMEELGTSQLVNNDRIAFLLEQPKMFFAELLVLLAALVALIFHKPFARYRFLFHTWVIVLMLFTLAQAKPYYAFGLYPVLLGIGSIRLESWLKKGWWRWLRPLLVVGIVVSFVPLISYIFPSRSAEVIAADQDRVAFMGKSTWEDGKEHDLPQDFADMRGWRELADKVLRLHGRLKADGPVLVFCSNYGEAGAINFYASVIEPRAVTFNADYAHWMQWEPAYRSMIFVQEAQDTDFRQWPEAMAFEMVVLVDSIVDPFARERGTRIYGCSLPKRPIRETVLNGPWR